MLLTLQILLNKTFKKRTPIKIKQKYVTNAIIENASSSNSFYENINTFNYQIIVQDGKTYRAECFPNVNIRTGWNNRTGWKMNYVNPNRRTGF